MKLEYFVEATAILSLAFVFWRARQALRTEVTSGKTIDTIREGAMGFLARTYRVLSLLVLAVGALLWISNGADGAKAVLAFMIGALLSALAGNIGIRVTASIVTGVTTISLGLLGITTLYIIFRDPTLILNFGLGASVVALFTGVGGNIYTKAIAITSTGDGREHSIGLGADIFESYSNAIIAAMAIGWVASALYGTAGILYPLGIAAIGVIATTIGVSTVRAANKGEVEAIMNQGFRVVGLIALPGIWWLTDTLFGSSTLFWVATAGVVAGEVIRLITKYHTPRTIISTALPIAIVSAAELIGFTLAGFYGIAIVATSMAVPLGITFASTAAKTSSTANTVEERLAGMSAITTSLALLITFITIADVSNSSITEPITITSLLIGGLLPFLFSFMITRATGVSVAKVAEEIRRQFRKKKSGTDTPDYNKCTTIAASAALQQVIAPAILVLIIPLLVGSMLGAQALGGLLTGCLLTGSFLVVMLTATTRYKILSTIDNFVHRRLDTHKAAVITGATTDSFISTSGSSLTILIKLMSMVAIIIAPLL